MQLAKILILYSMKVKMNKKNILNKKAYFVIFFKKKAFLYERYISQFLTHKFCFVKTLQMRKSYHMLPS